MKFLLGLYIIMVAIVFVNLSSEFILDGRYSGIASWLIVMLFLLGTVFFANARFYLNKSKKWIIEMEVPVGLYSVFRYANLPES